MGLPVDTVVAANGYGRHPLESTEIGGGDGMTGGDRVKGVRRRAGAWLLFAVLMVSAAGDEIAVLTMIFRMAEQGHSDMVAALLIAQLAPAVLLAPIVGHLVDRHDAGWLLAVASAVQGLALLPVVLVDHVIVLVIGMFAISVVGSVAMPAVLTLLPIIAGEAVPVRANAIVEGGRALATLGGPLLGGFLIAVAGTSIPLMIDAVSFFLVAAVLPLLRVHRPVEASSGRWWSGAGEGLKRPGFDAHLLPWKVVCCAEQVRSRDAREGCPSGAGSPR
jgi:MFS family permease